MTSVQPEGYIPGGIRRADVLVQFDTGDLVALEAQASHQTDDTWSARHDGYARAGVVDVWLWRPGWWVGLAGQNGQPVWQLDVDTPSVVTPVARPHRWEPAWWHSPDRQRHAPHWPPCPHDSTYDFPMPLSECRLTPRGLLPSPDLQAHLDAEWDRTYQVAQAQQREAHQRQAHIRTLREQRQRQHSRQANTAPHYSSSRRYEQLALPGAPPPAWLYDDRRISDAKAGLRKARTAETSCPTCGYYVSPTLADGRHIGC